MAVNHIARMAAGDLVRLLETSEYPFPTQAEVHKLTNVIVKALGGTMHLEPGTHEAGQTALYIVALLLRSEL